MKRIGMYTGTVYDKDVTGIKECCRQISDDTTDELIDNTREELAHECLLCRGRMAITNTIPDCMAKTDIMFNPYN